MSPSLCVCVRVCVPATRMPSNSPTCLGRGAFLALKYFVFSTFFAYPLKSCLVKMGPQLLKIRPPDHTIAQGRPKIGPTLVQDGARCGKRGLKGGFKRGNMAQWGIRKIDQRPLNIGVCLMEVLKALKCRKMWPKRAESCPKTTNLSQSGVRATYQRANKICLRHRALFDDSVLWQKQRIALFH